MNKFYLTRRAAFDLHQIYDLSIENWGLKVAEQYMDDLYQTFQRIIKNPELGRLRKKRSKPFLMVAARKHYIIYEPFKKDIIIATILHQVRDIEGILHVLGPSLTKEISQIKRSVLN